MTGKGSHLGEPGPGSPWGLRVPLRWSKAAQGTGPAVGPMQAPSAAGGLNSNMLVPWCCLVSQ